MRVPTLRTMAAVPPSQPARLLFPGGGIFFWWQAGAITALSRRIDLSTAPCCGASAGALAATLAACDVDMELALERALALSIEARAFERGPFGLYGIWGGVIRTWLDELLPADAARRCDGRVELLVAELPGLLPAVAVDAHPAAVELAGVAVRADLGGADVERADERRGEVGGGDARIAAARRLEAGGGRVGDGARGDQASQTQEGG